jgi:hypothetical protein
MKQSAKIWQFGVKGFGTLYDYVNNFIDEGYTIISITPVEYDTVTISKTHSQIVKAIILVSK